MTTRPASTSFFQTDSPGWLPPGTGTVETVEEETVGKFSAERPTDHALVVEELKRKGIPAGVAGDLANELGGQYLAQKGSWPTVFELLTDPTAVNRATYTQSGMWALPPAFGVRNPDGTVQFYRNDPLQGLQAVTPANDDFGFGLKDLASSGTPVFGFDEIRTIMGSAGFGDDPRPPGGGDGAATLPPAFDRDQLTEIASQMWRGMLIAEPDGVDRIVDDYTAKATSFLMNEGGRLDFETFVLDRMRDTARYKTLYRNKANGISEQAHLAQYVNAYRQLGMADRGLNETVTAGASSGASPQGFTERLQRSTEYMAANQGSFSQKFGNTIAQLGIRGT